MIEYVPNERQPIAIIVRSGAFKPGVEFVTPHNYSQQLGLMNHSAGTLISPHTHKHISREVTRTHEVLIIRRGRLRVDFYDNNKCYLQSRVLEPGDLIHLISGGHGFEVLENIEMIEIKQGPYITQHDKDYIEAVSSSEIRIIEKQKI